MIRGSREVVHRRRSALLGCPIVGVAVDDWTTADLRRHLRSAIRAGGETVELTVYCRREAGEGSAPLLEMDVRLWEMTGDVDFKGSTPGGTTPLRRCASTTSANSTSSSRPKPSRQRSPQLRPTRKPPLSRSVCSANRPGRRRSLTEVQESRKSRAGRHGRSTALYLGAALLTTALVLLVILIVQNTDRVRVGWVFGHSRVSLVFLILFASILGWIAGIATSIVFRRRTRRP